MKSTFGNSLLREPIYAKAAPEALGVLRILVYGIWLFHFLMSSPRTAASLPAGLFQCSGILCLIPEGVWDIILTVEGLTALKWFGIAAIAAAALGVRPFPLVAAPAFLAILLYDGTAKGFGGFVNHAQFGPLYAALLLVLFPAADGLSIMGRRPRGHTPRLYGAPLLGAAVVLSVAYCFVGTRRLLAGGLEIFTGEALRNWIVARTVEGSNFGFELGLTLVESDLNYFGMRIGFAVVTLFEILTPLAIFSPLFRWVWLAVMVPFHVVTLLTMNIFFWENLLLIAVLFTPLAHALAARTGITPPRLYAQAAAAPSAPPPARTGGAAPPPD